MTNPATFRRTAAAASLLGAGLLTFVAILLMPDMSGDQTDRLASVAAAGTPATWSAFLFLLSQLPLIGAALAIGHLLRGGSPVLSNLGATALVAGAFGHSAYGSVMLLHPVMAQDTASLEVHGLLLDSLESGPLLVFMATGLAGTVVGLLLLSIGLWRAGTRPRWVAPVLWAFLLVEFVGNAVTSWAGPVAGVLFLVAMAALAVTVWRSPTELWGAGTDASTDHSGRPRTRPTAAGGLSSAAH